MDGRMALPLIALFVVAPACTSPGEVRRPAPTPPPVEYQDLLVDVEHPISVRGGQAFDVHVDAQDEDGEIRGFLVRFGDGASWGGLPFDLVCTGVVGEQNPSEGPSERTETVEHAYRRAGDYMVTVVVTSGGCDASASESRTKQTVEVRGDALASDGPLEPRAKIGHAYFTGGNREVLVSDTGGYDDDGYVHRIAIDWGDGTPVERHRRGFDDCNDRNGERWPRGWFSDQMRHAYARPGDYEVRVRVWSSGCDGRGVQSDRAARVLTFPPDIGS